MKTVLRSILTGILVFLFIGSHQIAAAAIAAGKLDPTVIVEGEDVSLLANVKTEGGNTALGQDALTNNTGNFNTALGSSALNQNQTGTANTAIGNAALQRNQTGAANTAIGNAALRRNTSGDNNTAIGTSVRQKNGIGEFNTATGSGALQNNTTGSWNTAIGGATLNNNQTGTGNTAVGGQALANSTASNNTAIGYLALQSSTTGTGNTAIGDSALLSNGTGSNNTAIGSGANVGAGNLTNATAIGVGAVVDASNKIRLGDANVTVIEGQVGFTFTSDKNKKENFQPINGEEVLRKIRNFTLTSWNYIGQDPAEFRHYGPMAQDFFAAFGHDSIGKIGTPTTITSTDMAGILMIAVQALEKRTKGLEEKEAQLAALEARLAAMEQRLGTPMQSGQTRSSEALGYEANLVVTRSRRQICTKGGRRVPIIMS